MAAYSSEQAVWDDLIENDDVFDALSDGQRRHLLVVLLDSDQQHVPDLSNASRKLMEAHEAFLDQFVSGQVEIPGVDEELVQKHHAHLPKLVECGFIEWHQEDQLVTKGPRFDELKPFLELMESHQKDRPTTDPLISFQG